MDIMCPLRFMGDVMIGRLVNDAIIREGYAYPWGDVLPIIGQDGINVINLETTLTQNKQKVPKVFNFRAGTDKVQSLVEGNIHIANIANNHILDYGYEGLHDTIDILNKSGIEHVGAGNNELAAKKPVIMDYQGIKFGFIGCTDNEPFWKATKEKAGTNFVQVGSISDIEKTIVEAKRSVDILILSIHWGGNMVVQPSEEKINFAHQMIDLGVDIVHGHSAHIFQGIEIYRSKVILYDTGDFIDDYVVDPKLRNDRSLLFVCSVGKNKIESVQLVPVMIKNMQVNLAHHHDYEWIMARMKQLCGPMGTTIGENGRIEVF